MSSFIERQKDPLAGIKFTLALAVPIFLVLATVVNLAGAVYSEGTRVGHVTKLTNKGFVCKTWEGEMALEGLKANANGGMSNVFSFSILDESLVPKIQDAMNGGEEVSLQYSQKYIYWPCTQETSYVITGVK